MAGANVVTIGETVPGAAGGELGGYTIVHDGALLPDSVTLSEGLTAGRTLRLQAIAAQLYGYEHSETPRVLDLGCGVAPYFVGCIAAAETSSIELVGVDIDAAALELARENVDNALERRQAIDPGLDVSVSLVHGDWHEDELWEELGDYDLIFVNPPYLSEDQPIPEGYEMVPRSHMYTGDIRADCLHLMTNGFRHLRHGGEMTMRTSSRDTEEGNWIAMEMVGPAVNASRRDIIYWTCLRPYDPDRMGLVTNFTLAPPNWRWTLAPQDTARTLIMADKGIDIDEPS